MITTKDTKGLHRQPSKIHDLPVLHEKKRSRLRNKFQRQTSILLWKSYLQRQRRWRLLALETFTGAVLFLTAIFIAKPIFLTPLQVEAMPALSASDILSSLHSNTILGYAPDMEPYNTVMSRAATLLGTNATPANTEDDLNAILYNRSRGTPIKDPVIWVKWKEEANNRWVFSIRSTERARLIASVDASTYRNPHLRVGFLAVQVAISQAVLENVTPSAKFEVSLVSMPVSPLMQESQVRKALSLILLCFTLAFLPAILETEALVVWETENMFKRALRMRNVSYTSMYVSWIFYAYLTAMPVCVLGAVTIILTFRWIHLVFALVILLAYVSVMAMLALVMAMFHNKYYIACIWTTLFTLLQTYMAELLVLHEYDTMHVALTFILHIILPPLGLIHAFNEFALLSTGKMASSKGSLIHMIVSWGLLISIYFALLMILQRTIGQRKAIGGQVSWRSIIFKKKENINVLHRIEQPSRSEKGKVQEVDGLVALAMSFKDVCKNIMGKPVMKNLTFDVYRGEYTVMYAERIQDDIIDCLDDLMTGLTSPDHGEIRMLGEHLTSASTPLNQLYKMGYCHHFETLIDDLTVEEHFSLFTMICLWRQAKNKIREYGLIRCKTLLEECDLVQVRHTRVRHLGVYYKAQLCWALAKLLEPRIIIVRTFEEDPIYRAVITDKIMQFRKHIAIVSLSYSTLDLEHTDRIFVFDHKVLAFGGTPAYMFFRYGREYRVRLAVRFGNPEDSHDDDNKLLIERARAAGATVRAHLGSMLILRLPAIPTAPVAEFICDITDNPIKYNLKGPINISVADSEEIVRRAISESQSEHHGKHSNNLDHSIRTEMAKAALKRIAAPCKWQRRTFCLNSHMGRILMKFVTFHIYHRLFFILTLLSALISGLLLGLSISSVLRDMNTRHDKTLEIMRPETLTVEFYGKKTFLVLRSDKSSEALSVAQAYTMSETQATSKEIRDIFYIAMPHTESILEYLITRAIDSPQQYVYYYAYGMDISMVEDTLSVQALYSALHHDRGAAARSLARVYSSLLRHYTNQLDATIQVVDHPLAFDLSVWMKNLSRPPLFLQFLLILTISHITFLPSMEYGFIRHVQKHAMNFSPFRYWSTLYFCDVIFFWMLVVLMSITMIGTIYINIPATHFLYYDLLIIPFMLFLYGMSCIPQAYVFSLGPRVALNAMAFVIVNLVFGETTIFRQLFSDKILNSVLDIMCLSPQFNMAYAFVKIRQIFVYNTECIIFSTRNICSSNSIHKCCPKCGILEECFSRRSYFNRTPGILMEILAMFITAMFFTTLLLLIEYLILKRVCKFFRKLMNNDRIELSRLNPGVARERKNVIRKRKTAKSKIGKIKMDTFGEYLCAMNITRKEGVQFSVHNVYLGLGKGEALAITALKRHGRHSLCDMLAGYKLPSDGNVWSITKWSLNNSPHMYCRHVSLSCGRATLPSWLTVSNALVLIAALRGVPTRHTRQEAKNLIEALEMTHLANRQVKYVEQTDLTRVHFAAAVIGAPPVIILDEVTAWQKYSVRRAMYAILYLLRKKGHAILSASSNIESHMSITNRLAVMIDGEVFDVGTIDELVERHSDKAFTVVVHLKDEVNIQEMFSRYFKQFSINDVSVVLVNVQIFDSELNWKIIFQRMENMQAEYQEIYSYIATSITMDCIYNSLLFHEKGLKNATGFFTWKWAKKIISSKPSIEPLQEALDALVTFERKYSITALKDLPWSVIFDTTSDAPSERN